MEASIHAIINKCHDALINAMLEAKADWHDPSYALTKVITHDGVIELSIDANGPEAIIIHNGQSDCECPTLVEAIEAHAPSWDMIHELGTGDDDDCDMEYNPHDSLPYGYADWGTQFRM